MSFFIMYVNLFFKPFFYSAFRIVFINISVILHLADSCIHFLKHKKWHIYLWCQKNTFIACRPGDMISLKALPVTSRLLRKKGSITHWRWKRISNQLYELSEVKAAAEPLTDMLKDEKTEIEMKTVFWTVICCFGTL